MIKIYTDGGCWAGDGAFAFAVIKDDEQVLHEVSGCYGDTTNNKMEMKAVFEALNYCAANEGNQYTIITDSQYVQKGLTEWIHNWKLNNWEGAAGPVKNKEIWQVMDPLYRSLRSRVRIEWVKGHNGNVWNEHVDKLCTIAMNKESERVKSERAAAQPIQ